MNKYHFVYLVWLLPGYLLFLFLHQAGVFYGINDTWENGASYTAEVIDFDIKQIAAQTNGYVVLKFDTNEGETIERKLSLPVEMAATIQENIVVPVRYQAGGFQEIVMIPAYSTQKGLVLTNMAMAFTGFLLTVYIAWLGHRYAGRKLSGDEEEWEIERIDR